MWSLVNDYVNIGIWKINDDISLLLSIFNLLQFTHDCVSLKYLHYYYSKKFTLLITFQFVGLRHWPNWPYCQHGTHPNLSNHCPQHVLVSILHCCALPYYATIGHATWPLYMNSCVKETTSWSPNLLILILIVVHKRVKYTRDFNQWITEQSHK